MPESPDDLVVLRPEGLYCPPGDFHIDPWRPVPRAVITHGHGDHARGGMGEYHCSRDSIPILRWRLGGQVVHAHDYGKAFTLGRARVSLHPAGHVLGSAQVRIEADGQVWVASGDYKRQPDPTCAPFEPVQCDTFITEATFGLPVYRWPDTRQVAADIVQWRRQCAERGEAAILYCYALGKAQRVLAELRGLDDVPALLHGAIDAGVQVYRGRGGGAGLPAGPPRPAAGADRRPHLRPAAAAGPGPAAGRPRRAGRLGPAAPRRGCRQCPGRRPHQDFGPDETAQFHDYLRRLCRSLGLLLTNGAPLTTAWRTALAALSNAAYRDSLSGVGDAIAEGEGLAPALEQSGVVTPLAVHMLRVGEQSGRLGAMADQAAGLIFRGLPRRVRPVGGAAPGVPPALAEFVRGAAVDAQGHPWALIDAAALLEAWAAELSLA